MADAGDDDAAGDDVVVVVLDHVMGEGTAFP